MEENKVNNTRFIEEVDIEQSADRWVIRDGKWVCVSKFRKEILDYVCAMSLAECEMCLKCIYMGSTDITVRVGAFLEKYEGMYIEVASIIETKHPHLLIDDDCDAEYTCEVVTQSFGTVSSITGTINAYYSYAYECNGNGSPDYDGAAVQLASGFYKSDDKGTDPERFVRTAEVRNYHPEKNTMIDYCSIVKDATTQEGVMSMMKDSYDMFSPSIKRQFLGDLVKAAPAKLVTTNSKLKVVNIRSSQRTVLIKAPVVRCNMQYTDFVTGVNAISKLSTGLGSEEHGMGRMMECHYDGIMGLRGSSRTAHEYITDYIPEKVDIVFVNTRNDRVASAVYRQQRSFMGDEHCVVVIYSACSVQQGKLRQVLQMREGHAVSVLRNGVIGLPPMVW